MAKIAKKLLKCFNIPIPAGAAQLHVDGAVRVVDTREDADAELAEPFLSSLQLGERSAFGAEFGAGPA